MNLNLKANNIKASNFRGLCNKDVLIGETSGLYDIAYETPLDIAIRLDHFTPLFIELRGYQFNSAFYTEMGGHNHTVSSHYHTVGTDGTVGFTEIENSTHNTHYFTSGARSADHNHTGSTDFSYATHSHNLGTYASSCSWTRLSNVVTVTSNGHSVVVGQTVIISNVTGSITAGYYVVTATNTNTFSFNNSGSNSSGTLDYLVQYHYHNTTNSTSANPTYGTLYVTGIDDDAWNLHSHSTDYNYNTDHSYNNDYHEHYMSDSYFSDSHPDGAPKYCTSGDQYKNCNIGIAGSHTHSYSSGAPNYPHTTFSSIEGSHSHSIIWSTAVSSAIPAWSDMANFVNHYHNTTLADTTNDTHTHYVTTDVSDTHNHNLTINAAPSPTANYGNINFNAKSYSVEYPAWFKTMKVYIWNFISSDWNDEITSFLLLSSGLSDFGDGSSSSAFNTTGTTIISLSNVIDNYLNKTKYFQNGIIRLRFSQSINNYGGRLWWRVYT